MTPLGSAAARDILIDGLSRVATIVRMPLADNVGRLDLGKHPKLYLDTGSSDEELCRVMVEALLALTSGPAAATAARTVRRLHSVS